MRSYPNAAQLAKLKKPGRYAVGHGCYLQISKWGTRAWLLRYIRDGKARSVGLGSCTYVTLAEARHKAFEAQRQLQAGIDVLEVKRAAERQRKLAGMNVKTFRQCAEAYISAHESGWRGDASRHQWQASLGKYVYPRIGALAVSDVDLACVLSVVEPIWTEVPETARRVRNRIELILDWATARGLRTGDNPARWRGLLESLLPDQRKANGVKHHAALKYADIGTFMQQLRARDEIAARALEFQILTATRPGEACGARWDEIEGDVWIIPPERMKNHREHRVPLSSRAVELLAALPRDSAYLFAGDRSGEALQSRAPGKLLRRLGCNITAHGFRSTFRDWAAETTAYPNHVVEQALAHAIPNAVEAAYRRGDLIDQRRRLMQAWSEYSSRPHVIGEVVPIRGAS